MKFSDIDRAATKSALSSLTLNVDGTPFAVSDVPEESGATSLVWTAAGLTWTDGQTVSLSLTAPTPPPAPDIEVTPGPETLTVEWECKEDVEGQGGGAIRAGVEA